MLFFEQSSILPFRFSPSLLLSIILLFPLRLFGEEQTAIQPELPVPQIQQAGSQPVSSVPQARQSEYFDYMLAPRDYLSSKVTGFASYLDHFFGGDRHYQESNQSVLQLNLTRVTGYGGDGNYKFAARLNLKLPATEGRFRLLLETDPENDVTDEPKNNSVASVSRVSVPGSISLAVRYAMKEVRRWYRHADAGVKFRGITTAPNPFVRTRVSYTAPIGEWRLKASESVFWFNSLGLGETSQVDFERIISAPLLFRASSNATWLKDKENFDLRQDFTLFHTMNDRSALMYQASVIGVSHPQLKVTDYVVQALYRYRLNREWLFFELTPQLHFPEEKNYKSSPALSMRLEMLLNDSR